MPSKNPTKSLLLEVENLEMRIETRLDEKCVENGRRAVVIGKSIAPPRRRGGRNYTLVPVRGEDRLDFLRSLIDRLVPGQTRPLAK